ncbi:MAG: hypothetical protein ACU0C9_03550 [Paracoccaceae bacterium]
MQGAVIFDPLLPWLVLTGAGLAVALFLGFAIWRGLRGWMLRGMAAFVLLLALANPSFQQEDRTLLSDFVLLVVDRTASQGISDRPDQIELAVEGVRARVAARANTELKIFTLNDAQDDGGTQLMARLADALAEVPRARIAGVFLLSDGQVHDLEHVPDLPAPLHVLLTGHQSDWDRRLIVKNAPAFAILGESVQLTLRVEDQGQVPSGTSQAATLNVSIDGAPPRAFRIPVGEDIELPLTVDHGGMNVIQFEIATLDGELTDRNNSAVIQINGVRDRLRVLLVSGEPHSGGRTWRNLLKSDSSVDLVHFTILRPPQKQDRVPVAELSLIAFPTRELFLDKVGEFDLIIFDRYRRRGILPSLYLDSVRRYVENGGAVLVAAGPAFATADSLFRSPLGDIMPADPTSRIIQGGFHPKISELGARHPVTAGLDKFGQPSGDGPGWGRWFRQVELLEGTGDTVMIGAEGQPLLVLDRVGEGRIALLASDHVWLWSRGFEGGGPQQELLRRLAHWMMKEPELEEEALQAVADGLQMAITRRTLGDTAREVEIAGPDGTVTVLPMTEMSPGRYVADYTAPDIGLYRLKQGDESTVIALGPSAPKEFEETVATGEKLSPLVRETRGGIFAVETGMPDFRSVRAGRVAAGRGWAGLTPRDAFLTTNIKITPLVPGWLFLLLASLLSVAAWLHEGRR